MPFWPKCCSLNAARKTITVEPVFLFFSLANNLRAIVFQTLLYEKVCSDMFNSTVCKNLKDPMYKEQETGVQKLASEWEFYESFAYTLPSIFVNLLYGGMSDRVSRKLPMILSPIGAIANAVVLLVLSQHMDAPIPWILLGTLMNAVTGGMITMITCSLSYLSVITTEKTRTWRISIAEAMMLISGALALFISGDLLKVTSFEFVFSVVIGLNILVILYVVFWLKDVDDGIQKTPGNNGLSTICNWRYFTDSILVLFKKREHNRRVHVLVQLLIIAFFIFAIAPAWTLSYLFLRHEPLSWTPTMFGHFSGLNAGLRGICLLLALPLMKKYAKMTDTMIMIIGSVSGILSLVVFGVSTETWMVYLVPFLGFFGPSTIISIRGLISTMVEKSELGKIFGVVASLESLSFLLASCLYNYVLYPHTVKTFPGMSFLVGGATMGIPLALSIWLHRGVKKEIYNTLVEDVNDKPDAHVIGEEELSAIA
ncbi:hypothetical protein CAPTEDRAFT_180882 [Capitella teleta]|uniref:Major facilitator superfamily (MFS) profile domain-containing protein n=1 Tax=Capitella teleta TaxID=283909 RepID=R7TXM4_CAPTE|nr:hypothetical protein CAPTEDRAFT_180882 [Capitella teleta]|eukprot:ELT95720.1 hypothetical protein CAPTEDRAFT_180882 [Capitella teleta]